jgi:hypothetical protein
VFSPDGSLLTAILRNRRNKSRLKNVGKQLLPANQFSQTPAFFLLNFFRGTNVQLACQP